MVIIAVTPFCISRMMRASGNDGVDTCQDCNIRDLPLSTPAHRLHGQEFLWINAAPTTIGSTRQNKRCVDRAVSAGRVLSVEQIGALL
ncbi:MAG: hypothetical protein KKB02_00145 [Alphaproteobacteria bacterium]|nr:hypothetical protein [Alphaproteobacteria bacterium]